MSVEQNKEVIRRFYAEVMGGTNVDLVDELVVEDFVDHGETLFGSPRGRETLKEAIVGGHSIFPDMHVTLDDMIASGDYVGVRGTMRCTQQGDFLGIAATGNELQWKGIAMFRLENGKIAERWFNSDSLSVCTQLGLVQAPSF
jgi:predicted ester cyclase